MRTIYLWRGHHGPEFQRLFAKSWDRGDLLIACPPTDLEPTFVQGLPEGLIECVGDWSSDFAATLPERRGEAPVYPDTPILGVFTTGTTRATQKLVLYSRRNVMASQDSIFGLFDAARVDTIFCYPQPYHVFGLLLGHALARLKGLTIVCPEGPYGRHAHDQWLGVESGSLLTLATPSHLLDLAAHLRHLGKTPRPTYSCILGGAKVDATSWRLARDVARIEAPSIGYGCTEASPGITHLPPGVEPLVDGDIGWPLAHVAIDFGDAGDTGGYTIHGPGVCLATVEDGQVRFALSHTVRDELQMLEDGRLAFAHRTDMVLNRGGEKFPLERIEAVLKTKLGVDAICVAVPDARLGSELGIIASAPVDLSTEALFETLSAVFKRRFNPAHMRRVARLPLNPSAKPDRKAAANLLLAAEVQG